MRSTSSNRNGLIVTKKENLVRFMIRPILIPKHLNNKTQCFIFVRIKLLSILSSILLLPLIKLLLGGV